MANYVVTSRLDTGDDRVVTGDLSAEMADGGGLSLREAVLLANATIEADTITFDPGAFSSRRDIIVGEPLTLSSDITIDGDIDGDGRRLVVLDGNMFSPLVQVVDGDSTLSSLFMTSGRSAGAGGAIQVAEGGSLTVENSFVGGSAAVRGGGIFNAGTLEVIDSTIVGNRDLGTGGLGGGVYSTGDTTLLNVTLANNVSVIGGGLYVEAGETRVINTTITGNFAVDAAAGMFSHADASLVVANSLVTGNGLTTMAGGNLVAEGAVTVTNSIVTEPATPQERVFAAYEPIAGAMGAGGALTADDGFAIAQLRADIDNPALDAGDDSLAPATDARGEARRDQIGAANNGANISDLGAVELAEPIVAPVIIGFNDPVTVVEDDPANSRIDADVVIAHDDHDARNGGLGDYAGASLLIERDGGEVIRGEFGIDLDGASFTRRGNVLLDTDGNAFATLHEGINRLLVRFTSHEGVATSALVTEVAQRFTFENELEREDTALTARLTFTDDAGRTDTGSVAVTLVATDDAPLFRRPDLEETVSREGTDPRDFYGFDVAAAGDVDGDGRPDVIVGAERGSGARYAEVLSGADGSVIHRFTSPELNDGFGFVAGVGDVDGDGFADLAVGATFTGIVRVYSGADGAVLHTVTGPRGSGFTIAGLGDVDGDGFADFAVGGSDSVSVVSGATGGTLFTVSGNAIGFGLAVAGPGDLDGDGVGDLVVGSPLDNGGRVAVYSGADGGFLYDVRGAPGEFGLDVAGTGDIDGDGVADFVVGAPTAGDGGMAFVYSGRDGALIQSFTGTDSSGDSDFGLSVAGTGDVNGDGVPDILVGIVDIESAGEARLFSGADGALLFTIEGRPGDGIGRAVAGPGDLDGDGFADLVVGASESPSGQENGRVTFYETGNGPVSTVDGTATFNERGAPALLDDIVDTYDVETETILASPELYESQTLTLSRQGGADADDQFTFAPMPNISAGVDGLFFGDARIADYTNEGGTLTIAFTSRAGVVPGAAIVSEVLSAIRYENASPAPPDEVALAWTFGRDGATVSDISTVTITPVDDPATAADDVFTIGVDTALSGDLFADNGNGADTDPDAPLAVAAVNGRAEDVGAPIVLASGATLTVREDGSFDYAPPSGFDGPDVFTYTLAGGATARVDITFDAQEPTPAAVDDHVAGARDGAIFGDVGLNDVLSDDAAPVFALETAPEIGDVALDPDGTFVYTPLPRWFGSDTFSYRVTDASGREDTADVTVVVEGPEGLTTGPVTFDTGNRLFSSRFSTFDAEGERVGITIAYDNGWILEKTFGESVRIYRKSTDTVEAFNWFEAITSYDTLEDRTRTIDDGRLFGFDFERGAFSSAVVTDVAHAHPWSQINRDYDENGDVLNRTVPPEDPLLV